MQRRFIIARSAAIFSGLSGVWALLLGITQIHASRDAPWSGTDALSALSFCILAVAIWLLSGAPSATTGRQSFRYRVGIACGALVFLVGTLGVAAYAFGAHLTLVPGDTFARFDRDDALGMSVNGAASFALCGLAVLTLDSSARFFRQPSEWLAFAVAITALLAVLGYL